MPRNLLTSLRALVALILFASLAACTAGGALAPSRALGQNGPASASDCTPAEIPPATVPENLAQAGAIGGQSATQAPVQSRDVPVRPLIQNERGGTAKQSSADSEHRVQVTGGAQNVCVNAPATAEASAGTGGVSFATLEARKNVELARDILRLASLALPADPAAIAAARKGLEDATDVLLASAVNDRSTTTYNQQGQQNSQYGVSTSSGEGESNSDVSRAAAEASAKSAKEALRTLPKEPLPAAAPPPKPAANANDGMTQPASCPDAGMGG